MAIITSKDQITLKLELDGGIVDGVQKVKNKSFTQINTNAEDLALYNTASILSNLQERNLLKIKKVETTSLLNE